MLIRVDADFEEPCCDRCDNITSDQRVCNRCGPEHGWRNYYRIINRGDLPSKQECEYSSYYDRNERVIFK